MFFLPLYNYEFLFLSPQTANVIDIFLSRYISKQQKQLSSILK